MLDRVIAQESLGDKIMIAAVGPLVAAIIGTLVIGLFVTAVNSRADHRRQLEYQRSEAGRQFELRQDLVSEMTRVIARLDWELRRLDWQRPGGKWERPGIADERKQVGAGDLSKDYHDFRVEADVLEMRLRGHFASRMPARTWHSAVDLLTILYVHASRLVTDALLAANAGPEHSGLTLEQLRDPGFVRHSFESARNEAVNEVLASELIIPG